MLTRCKNINANKLSWFISGLQQVAGMQVCDQSNDSSTLASNTVEVEALTLSVNYR